MSRRVMLVAALAGIAVLVMAGEAVADTTTVGETVLTPNAGLADMTGQSIPVFQGDAGSNYTLTAPQTGTITSWSFLSAGIATGKQFVLRVFAPVDATDTSWRALATSNPVSVTSATGVDAVNGPFPANIAIGQGWRIALEPVDDSFTPIEQGVAGVDGIRYFAAPVGDGSSAMPVSVMDNGQVVPIQATIDYTGATSPPANPVQVPANQQPPRILGTPSAGQTLTCDPGVWTGSPTFSYAWSQTTLVAKIVANHLVFEHEVAPLGTGSTVTVGDVPPATTTISCSVTATNSAGAVAVAAAEVAVLALRPVLAPSRGLLQLGPHGIPSPNPAISPRVGVGGQNVCTSGRWEHYPTKYAYYWYEKKAGRLKSASRSHPQVAGAAWIANGATLVIPASLERHRIFCGVQATNTAGTSSLALSNTYVVPATAPVSTAAPDVSVTWTSPTRSAGSPAVDNPSGVLEGNKFVLSCGPGRWNRSDLTYSYQWVFDLNHASGSPAPPLTGMVYTGDSITLELLFAPQQTPSSYRLQINGGIPSLGGVARPSIDYLDDYVQCEVSATTHNGVRADVLSRPVRVAGPVVGAG